MTEKEIEGRVRTVELEIVGMKTSADLFFKNEWPEFKAEHKALAVRVGSLERTIVRWGAVVALAVCLAGIFGPEIHARIFGLNQVVARP